MGALIALLLPIIPGLIQGVEKIFSSKPKSGVDKAAAVVDALRMVVERMMAAGVTVDGAAIPEKSVSDDLLRGAIEAVLAKLKATGQLDAQPGVAGGNVFIVRGSVTPLGVI